MIEISGAEIAALVVAALFLNWRLRPPKARFGWVAALCAILIGVYVYFEGIETLITLSYFAISNAVARLCRGRWQSLAVLLVVVYLELVFDPARSAPRHFIAAVVLLALGAPWLGRRIARRGQALGWPRGSSHP